MPASIRRHGPSPDHRPHRLRAGLYPTPEAIRVHLIHDAAGAHGGSLCALRPINHPWRSVIIDPTPEDLCQKCAALAAHWFQIDQDDFLAIAAESA